MKMFNINIKLEVGNKRGKNKQYSNYFIKNYSYLLTKSKINFTSDGYAKSKIFFLNQ